MAFLRYLSSIKKALIQPYLKIRKEIVKTHKKQVFII